MTEVSPGSLLSGTLGELVEAQAIYNGVRGAGADLDPPLWTQAEAVVPNKALSQAVHITCQRNFSMQRDERKRAAQPPPTRWVAGRLYLSILPAGTRDTLTETHTHGFGFIAICGGIPRSCSPLSFLHSPSPTGSRSASTC